MEARTLINMQKLPQRDRLLDRATAEEDVKEAIERCANKLRLRAQVYHVTGWHEDASVGEGGFTFDFSQSGTVVGSLRMVRD